MGVTIGANDEDLKYICPPTTFETDVFSLTSANVNDSQSSIYFLDQKEL